MKTQSSSRITKNGQNKGMRVLIVGLPLFSERLYNDLREFDEVNTYYRLDTYYSKLDRIKAFFLISSIDVVYSINGTLERSRLIDLAFKKNIPVIMNWVGTDVLKAGHAYKNGKHCKEYTERAVHFCEVSWIREELKEMEIDAEVVNFISFDERFELKEVESEKLTILTYIPENRAKFYGVESLLKLSREFPEINFIVAGMTGTDYTPLPENVQALGWVKDMASLFEKAHVCIRFPEHDGLSVFILEALARGKKVLYKYPLEHCDYCPNEEKLSERVADLLKQYENGVSMVNSQGAQYIAEQFNREHILSTLVRRFKQIGNRK